MRYDEVSPVLFPPGTSLTHPSLVHYKAASAVGSFDTSRSNYEDGKTDVASVAHILPASAAALTGLPTDHSTASYTPSCKSESKRGLSPSASPGLALDAAEAAAAPPDGGLRAWLNVLGGFLVLASSFGVVNALGAFQAYHEHVRLAPRGCPRAGNERALTRTFSTHGPSLEPPSLLHIS